MRIIDKRIKRVFIGILDPNPEIYQKGMQYMLDQGIKVDFFDSDLAEEIRRENENFVQHFQNLANVGPSKIPEAFRGASREENRPIL